MMIVILDCDSVVGRVVMIVVILPFDPIDVVLDVVSGGVSRILQIYHAVSE
jgi:hypothetical protein